MTKTHAQVQAEWRKRYPDRYRAVVKRQTARQSAAARLANRHYQEFLVLFEEECEKRSVTPFEEDLLPSGAGAAAYGTTPSGRSHPPENVKP